jgi:hypothetical protein
MALSRLFGGWIAVVVWLLLWQLVGSRLGTVRGEGKRVLRTVVAGGLLAWRLAPA